MHPWLLQLLYLPRSFVEEIFAPSSTGEASKHTSAVCGAVVLTSGSSNLSGQLRLVVSVPATGESISPDSKGGRSCGAGQAHASQALRLSDGRLVFPSQLSELPLSQLPPQQLVALCEELCWHLSATPIAGGKAQLPSLQHVLATTGRLRQSLWRIQHYRAHPADGEQHALQQGMQELWPWIQGHKEFLIEHWQQIQHAHEVAAAMWPTRHKALHTNTTSPSITSAATASVLSPHATAAGYALATTQQGQGASHLRSNGPVSRDAPSSTASLTAGKLGGTSVVGGMVPNDTNPSWGRRGARDRSRSRSTSRGGSRGRGEYRSRSRSTCAGRGRGVDRSPSHSSRSRSRSEHRRSRSRGGRNSRRCRRRSPSRSSMCSRSPSRSKRRHSRSKSRRTRKGKRSRKSRRAQSRSRSRSRSRSTARSQSPERDVRSHRSREAVALPPGGLPLLQPGDQERVDLLAQVVALFLQRNWRDLPVPM
jgi:hypothetical protein